MHGPRPLWFIVALTGLLGAGCDRRQPWEITNGAGLGSSQPPQIVAEVYEGGECGPCEPTGDRVYCSSLTRGNDGPIPSGLRNGEPYCFMATALDEEGDAYAIGCQDAVAGDSPVRVVLAPIQPGRFVVPSCQDGPIVFVDGSFPDAGPGPDAGPRMDGGPPSPDAGPPRDAGPPPYPDGTVVRVTFAYEGSGSALIFEQSTGGFVGDIPQVPGYGQLTATVGEDVVRVEATPASGWELVEIRGGGCSDVSPCVIPITRPDSVRVVFGPR